jgi:hypothetical protein
MQSLMSLLFGFRGPSSSETRSALSRRNVNRRPLQMERLEGRYALSAISAPLPPPTLPDIDSAPAQRLVYPAPAQMGPHANLVQAKTVGDRMVDFLQNKIGQRIGSGECADVAVEALRVGGGKFLNVAVDSPNSGDYVWGTLVAKVEFKNGKAVDSAPSKAARPGDVIQYRDATFSNGKRATHHTAVVAAVNDRGRPTAVFEQNIGKLTKNGNVADRTVHRNSINLGTLTGGWVRIYRPIVRYSEAGRFEFTIVNNTKSQQTVTRTIGKNTSTVALVKANTYGSFKNMYVTTTGTAKPTLTINGKSVTVQDAAGYEIYTTSTGSASIRKLLS